MKKITILIIAAMVLGITVQAQDGSSAPSFKDGDNLFNAGIGFGYYGGYGLYGNRTNSIPALTANYEIGVHEYFGVGPYVGYKSYGYRYAGGDYGFNIIAVGARGSFHYSTLLKEELGMDINDDKLDLYILAHIGFEVTTYTGSSGNSEGSTSFRFRPALGIRYYLGNNFAIFGEGGNGALSYFTFGVTLKM